MLIICTCSVQCTFYVLKCILHVWHCTYCYFCLCLINHRWCGLHIIKLSYVLGFYTVIMLLCSSHCTSIISNLQYKCLHTLPLCAVSTSGLLHFWIYEIPNFSYLTFSDCDLDPLTLKTGWPSASHHTVPTGSFNFKPIVLPEMSFEEKKHY